MVLVNIRISGSLRDHLSQPPICGLNLPHNMKTHHHQALLTYPHVRGLGVLSFYDHFCLGRSSVFCWTQISQILPTRSLTPSLELHRRPSGILRVWGWSCVPSALSPRPKEPQLPPPRSHTSPELWSVQSRVEQLHPVTVLQMWPEIMLTLTVDPSLTSTSLLHSCVHFLFKRTHDQLCIMTNSCIQHLLISIKPFVRCFYDLT